MASCDEEEVAWRGECSAGMIRCNGHCWPRDGANGIEPCMETSGTTQRGLVAAWMREAGMPCRAA